MKILVTGGSGFLGGNFIEKYGKKYSITAPTSAEMDLMRMEPINRLFRDQKFDAVVHLAGKSDGRTSSALEADNLIMYKNIQYAAIVNGVKKLLVIGDAADFDLSRPVVSACEDMFGEVMPSDGYGLGRYLIHLLASKDKISTVLRFFSVYGKGADVGTNFIGAILARAITGKKVIEISQDRTFSTIYVEDAIKVIDAFLENDFPRGMYNVAADLPVTLTEVAKKARAYAKKNDRDVTVNVLYEGSANEMTANNDKLRLVLPSLKFTSHTAGINKTLDFLKSHKSMCKPKAKKADAKATITTDENTLQGEKNV